MTNVECQLGRESVAMKRTAKRARLAMDWINTTVSSRDLCLRPTRLLPRRHSVAKCDASPEWGAFSFFINRNNAPMLNVHRSVNG